MGSVVDSWVLSLTAGSCVSRRRSLYWSAGTLTNIRDVMLGYKLTECSDVAFG